MYPDTALPPRRSPHDHLERLRHTLTEPFWEREKRYAELRVPEDLARCLSISPLFGLFDTAVRDWHLSPVLAATVLVQYPKRLARTLRRRLEIPEETLSRILVAHRDGLLAKEGILPLLRRVAEGGPSAHEDLPAPCTEEELAGIIDASASEMPPLHQPHNFAAVLTGIVMGRVRGRIDGRRVAHKIREVEGKLVR